MFCIAQEQVEVTVAYDATSAVDVATGSCKIEGGDRLAEQLIAAAIL